MVILSAEDNLNEFHHRAQAMGRVYPDNVFIVPYPNLGGAQPFFERTRSGGTVATEAWREVEEQVLDMRPVLINIDPISCFVMADINADPAVGSYVLNAFSTLAAKAHACVLPAHHMGKMKDGVQDMDQARTVCRRMNTPMARNKVVYGGLCKCNFGGDEEMNTYVRQDTGLLACVEDQLQAETKAHKPYMLQDMENAVREWAERAQPFTRTGDNGVFNRRSLLPPALRDESRRNLEALLDELEKQGRVVVCVPVGGKTKNRYDVPDGPISQGTLKIIPGSCLESK